MGDVSTSKLGIQNSLMRLPREQHLLFGERLTSLQLQSSWEDPHLHGNSIFVSIVMHIAAIYCENFIQINDTKKLGGIIYERNSIKHRISDSKDNILLEVSLKGGLLPVAWKSTDQFSCNSSFDRYHRH